MTYDVTINVFSAQNPTTLLTSNSYDLKNCFLRCMNPSMYPPVTVIHEPAASKPEFHDATFTGN